MIVLCKFDISYRFSQTTGASQEINIPVGTPLRVYDKHNASKFADGLYVDEGLRGCKVRGTDRERDETNRYWIRGPVLGTKYHWCVDEKNYLFIAVDAKIAEVPKTWKGQPNL